MKFTYIFGTPCIMSLQAAPLPPSFISFALQETTLITNGACEGGRLFSRLSLLRRPHPLSLSCLLMARLNGGIGGVKTSPA